MGEAGHRVGDVIDGRYEVLHVHEQGGMGLVYRVRHLEWGTDLAMKCPRPGLFTSADDRGQFVAEAEAWVSLGLHPQVCGCHYVRVLDGVPCVFAEYVPGGSLAEWIRDRRLYAGGPAAALPRILDLAVQTARGLQHAHDRGLVHQDVKPANVLLDHHGAAKVTDFGLARVRRASSARPDATLQVTALGLTPAYASPEQSAGRPVGRRSDVFSFAVSVLELFTGGVGWFAGPVAGAALEAYRSREDRDPELPAMPADVAELLARCLAAEPADRPGTMAEVAARLAACYERAAGAAYPRPEPVAAELRADELNNRALSLLDLGREDEAERVFAEALAADPRHVRAVYNAGLLGWRRGRLTDEAVVTRVERARQDTGDAGEARHLLAQIQLERGDLAAARELLDGVPGEPDVDATRRALASGAVREAGCTATWPVPWPARGTEGIFVDVPGPPYESLPIALSGDGRTLLAGCADGRLRLWSVPDGRCVRTLKGHRRRIASVDLTPDGRYALSLCSDQVLRFWDLDRRRRPAPLHTGEPEPRTTHSDRPSKGAHRRSVRLTPDGRTAVATDASGTVRVWDTGTGRLLRSLPGHLPGTMPAVTDDGRRVLAACPPEHRDHAPGRQDFPVRLWDVATGDCLRTLLGHDSLPHPVHVTPDGRRAVLVTASTLRLWDLDSGRRVRDFTGGRFHHAAALSPDGRLLVSGEWTGAVRLWDPATGRCLRSYQRHDGSATVVRFAGDGRSVLSAGDDRTVRRWSLPGGHVCAPRLSEPRRHDELTRLGGQVDALLAAAEEARAAGRYGDALDHLGQARAVAGHERAPRVMAAWRRLARHTRRTGLRAVWSPRGFTAAGDWPVGSDNVPLALSDDGRTAVTGHRDGSLRLWDVETARCARVLTGHDGEVSEVRLNADGRRLLSSGSEGTLRLWSTATGACLRTLTGGMLPSGPPSGRSVAAPPFSFDLMPGGRQVVIAARDTVHWWDLLAGRIVRTVQADSHHALRLAVAPDGRTVAVGGQGGVLLLDAADGRRLHTLADARTDALRHENIDVLRFTHGGRRLLVAGGMFVSSDVVRQWDVATGEQLREFGAPSTCRHLAATADGGFAVIGGAGSHVLAWDVRTGRALRALDAEADPPGVTALAMTPDGQLAVARDRDGDLRVWELDWELEP